MKSFIPIFSYFFILTWGQSLLAEEVYRSDQQPQLLSAEIGDSDITFKQGNYFSVNFQKDVVGTRSLTEAQKKDLLDKVKVVYDPSSGRLKVESPKIVIGRVIAKVEVSSYQPLSIRVAGEDGDVKLLGAQLSSSEIRLADGDIEAQQIKVYGNSVFQTSDGDIQIYQPVFVKEIVARSTGDGKVRRMSQPSANLSAGNLQLTTRDGNITVY